MKTLRFFLLDIYFQWKHGIYALCAVLTVFCLCGLSLFEGQSGMKNSAALILSAAEVMGFCFTGSLIRHEKQHEILRKGAGAKRYIAAKAASLAVLIGIVGIISVIFADIPHPLIAEIGILLISSIATMLAIIPALKIKAKCFFDLASLLLGAIVFIPPFFAFFKGSSTFWRIHPAVAAAELIIGRIDTALLDICTLGVWNVVFWLVCVSSVKASFEKSEVVG